jgi:hypothetical protein
MSRWIGTALGLGLTLAYVPASYEAETTGRWAAAWAAIAILVWIVPKLAVIAQGETVGTCTRYRTHEASAFTWPGVLLLVLATLSLAWSPVAVNGVYESLIWGLLAACFVVGAQIDIGPIFIGAAIGMAVNSGFAILQTYGIHPVMEAQDVAGETSMAAPGLFGNKDHMAEAALLTLIPLVWSRRWILASALLPALLLPRDRAVLLAAGVVALLTLWPSHRSIAVACMAAALCGAAVLSLAGFKQLSAVQRTDIWRDTLAGMTWTGRGIGQFQNTYPEAAKRLKPEELRPSHADNDWLEIAYELGITGIALAVLFAGSVVVGTSGPYRLVFVAFCVIGCFSYPLHNPATSVLAFLAAGRVYTSRRMVDLGLIGGAIHAA